MRRLVIIFSCILLCNVCVGCNDKQTPFALESSYYEKGEVLELNLKEYKQLIEEEKNFLLFLYQPQCTTSTTFQEVVEKFSQENQITIYRMLFSTMKKTNLEEKIQYYPSFVIFHEGSVVDYLEADKEEDKERYQKVEALSQWLQEYIHLTNNSDTIE